MNHQDDQLKLLLQTWFNSHHYITALSPEKRESSGCSRPPASRQQSAERSLAAEPATRHLQEVFAYDHQCNGTAT